MKKYLAPIVTIAAVAVVMYMAFFSTLTVKDFEGTWEAPHRVDGKPYTSVIMITQNGMIEIAELNETGCILSSVSGSYRIEGRRVITNNGDRIVKQFGRLSYKGKMYKKAQ